MRFKETFYFQRLVSVLAVLLSGIAFATAGCANVMHGPKISVSLQGKPDRLHIGQAVTIAWRSANGPQKAWVSLWIEKTQTGHLIGPIASYLPMHGRFRWQVPEPKAARTRCKIDVTRSCIGAIAPGQTYAVVARLYTVADGSPAGISMDMAPKRLLASARSHEFVVLATKL